MHEHDIHVVGSRILVMGITFKEDCPDIRNTRVSTSSASCSIEGDVDVYDPWVDADEVENELGLRPITSRCPGHYEAVVVAVAHRQFREMGDANAFDRSSDRCR